MDKIKEKIKETTKYFSLGCWLILAKLLLWDIPYLVYLLVKGS